jgi:hypothetical protein
MLLSDSLSNLASAFSADPRSRGSTRLTSTRARLIGIITTIVPKKRLLKKRIRDNDDACDVISYMFPLG